MRSGSDGQALSGSSWSPTSPSGGLWIGMNDKENEGTWVWEDGSTVSQSYNNWITWDQQANQEPNGGDLHNCGIKWRNSAWPSGPSLAYGGWADQPCADLRNYACSMPAKEENCDAEKAMEEILHRGNCIQQETHKNSTRENLPGIDIFLNPEKEQYKEKIVKEEIFFCYCGLVTIL